MLVALSCDLRQRIVRAVENGSSLRQAGLRFAVSPSAAVKLMRRVRETGSAAAAKIGGHRRPVLEPHEAVLRALVDAKPDITLAEIQAELRPLVGVEVCLATIHASLPRLRLTRQKRA